MLLLIAAVATAEKNLRQEHRTLKRPDCVKNGGKCDQASICCDGPPDDEHYVCCAPSNNEPGKKSTCQLPPCE